MNEGVGELLRRYRAAEGLDQAELARRLHTSQSAISGWENEIRLIPDVKWGLVVKVIGCSREEWSGALWATARRRARMDTKWQGRPDGWKK